MKKFVTKLILFIIPIALISYGADVFISKELKKSNTYVGGEYTTWNAIYDGKINSDIIISGASRAWEHINSTRLGDSLHTTVYNIGINGHTFWMQYLRHRLLLEHNRKPKLIIHSLDIFTLRKGADLFEPDQFLPYMFFDNEMEKSASSLRGYSFFDYNLPLLRYYGKKEAIMQAMKLFIKPSGDSLIRIRGYRAQDQPWNNDFERVTAKTKSFEVKFDTASLNLFDRYLNECRTNNIKVIFVYSPEYIEGQRFVKNRDEIIGVYTKFSKKYDIPFYDYSNDSLSFQRKYFYNALHLNKVGAELFTGKLIQRLKADSLVTGMWPSGK